MSRSSVQIRPLAPCETVCFGRNGRFFVFSKQQTNRARSPNNTCGTACSGKPVYYEAVTCVFSLRCITQWKIKQKPKANSTPNTF